MVDDNEAMTNNNRILIFLHIGKASGATLHEILKNQYPDRAQYFTAGANDSLANDTFDKLTDREKGELGVVRGHVNYGMHRLLRQPSAYITMLRDPVDRIVSHYYYLKKEERHYLHRNCVEENWTLKDFILKTTDNDNGQMRALAGIADVYSFLDNSGPVVPFGACTEAHLDLAKKNLDKFLVVGLTERFDESVILMKRALGWDLSPLYIKQNVTADRCYIQELPSGVIDLIRRHNSFDLELYLYAKDLFEKQVKSQDESFTVEVRYFSLLNEMYHKHQNLLLEHHALEQEYQRVQHSTPIFLAQELEKHTLLMKITSACYRGLSSINKLISRSP